MRNGTSFFGVRGGSSYLRAIPATIGLLVVAAAPSGRAETALQAGEQLTYSVRWAVLPGAGQIRIAATERMSGGSPQLSITTETETRGFAKALLTFHARSESIFDLRTGRIVSLHETSTSRKKHSDYSVSFDYANQTALFTRNGSEPPRAIDLPDSDSADLITTLMKTRLWDLEVGQSRDVFVSYRDEFYDLTVHAIKQEQVKTPVGEFTTVVLEPRMERTAPKGMFKRGASVRVWVSRDAARLPVRFQVDFKIGTGVATLVNYTPPARAGGLIAAFEQAPHASDTRRTVVR
jgi:hypothetical protein